MLKSVATSCQAATTQGRNAHHMEKIHFHFPCREPCNSAKLKEIRDAVGNTLENV